MSGQRSGTLERLLTGALGARKRSKPKAVPKMSAEEKRARIAAVKASAHSPDCASLAVERTYRPERCNCKGDR